MTCGLTALLRPGGPVRVPLRECCVAALLGADGATPCDALSGNPSSVRADPHPVATVPGGLAAAGEVPAVEALS